MQLAGLGFVMFDQERNHMNDCCFEMTFAHYRYFVLSEAWTALQDS
jgi:hypothetical protein